MTEQKTDLQTDNFYFFKLSKKLVKIEPPNDFLVRKVNIIQRVNILIKKVNFIQSESLFLR